MVQWLRLGCFHCRGGPGLIPGWGTKIPQVTWYSQKKKSAELNFSYLSISTVDDASFCSEMKIVLGGWRHRSTTRVCGLSQAWLQPIKIKRSWPYVTTPVPQVTQVLLHRPVTPWEKPNTPRGGCSELAWQPAAPATHHILLHRPGESCQPDGMRVTSMDSCMGEAFVHQSTTSA